MQSAVETVSDIGLKINISVPATKLQEAYNKKVSEIAKTARVDGFRQGKVPTNYVKKVYGPSIEAEIVDDLVKRSFDEVCNEKKIAVAGIKKLDINQKDLDKDLEFTVDVETYPEIKFADEDFAGKQVEKIKTNVKAKDVDQAIDKLRKSQATWEKAGANSKAKMGEKVIIDFTAVQDGKDLAEGSANDFELELGSKYLIPGFEEGVVGHKAGEEFKLELKFPDDYHAKEQAGKDVVFTVKLKEIQRATLPEIDEEFCKKYGVAAPTEEEGAEPNLSPDAVENKDDKAKKETEVDLAELTKLFKEKIKGSLEIELKNQVESRFKNQIFDTLRECKEIPVPEALVESEITDMANHQLDRYRQQVGDKKATIDLDRNMFKEQAVKNVHLRLLVRAFIEQFDIKTDRELIKTKLSEAMGGHEITDDLLNWYYSEPQRLSQVEALALEDLVTENLTKKFAVVDKELSFSELMESR